MDEKRDIKSNFEHNRGSIFHPYIEFDAFLHEFSAMRNRGLIGSNVKLATMQASVLWTAKVE